MSSSVKKYLDVFFYFAPPAISHHNINSITMFPHLFSKEIPVIHCSIQKLFCFYSCTGILLRTSLVFIRAPFFLLYVVQCLVNTDTTMATVSQPASRGLYYLCQCGFRIAVIHIAQITHVNYIGLRVSLVLCWSSIHISRHHSYRYRYNDVDGLEPNKINNKKR